MSVEPGTVAPDFRARNQHGQPIELAALDSPALLFFYPFAFTTVCASELVALRDLASDFAAAGVRVLALSCDSPYALRVFAEAEDLTVDLVSDFWPHGRIATDYGVFDPDRGCAQRASFLVDTRRTVRWTTQSELGTARDLHDHLARARELVS